MFSSRFAQYTITPHYSFFVILQVTLYLYSVFFLKSDRKAGGFQKWQLFLSKHHRAVLLSLVLSLSPASSATQLRFSLVTACQAKKTKYFQLPAASENCWLLSMLLSFERFPTQRDIRESIIKEVKHVIPASSYSSPPGQTHAKSGRKRRWVVGKMFGKL